MPELPEVETVVRGLLRVLPGRRIASVKVLHKPSVSGSPGRFELLNGKLIESVFRRGKFIRVGVEGGQSLAIHLRMTGWLGVHTLADGRPPDAYARVMFKLDGKNEWLVFRDIRTFGRVWCGTDEAIEKLRALSKLGPEPLTIEADEFVKRLRSRGGRLKALLLNQEFLAGIGNIYADEALFAAALHPLSKASRVKTESARRLHAAIQDVLAKSIRAGGSSIENFRNPDGESGWFQRELLAYGREGEACRRCKTPIKRIVMGQRGTWFCPRCQKKS